MSWTKQTADDRPMWSGTDSLFNMNAGEGGKYTFPAGIIVVVSFLLLGMGEVSSDPFNSNRILRNMLFNVTFWPALAIFLFGLTYGLKWKRCTWSLTPSNDGLRYKASDGRSWAAPRDAVARVEVAKTADFMPSRRDTFGRVRSVSPHEWQVFLFMADGSRRTIYRANAGRDDCGTLAASIRAHLGAAVGKAGLSPSPAASAVPVAQGFDL